MQHIDCNVVPSRDARFLGRRGQAAARTALGMTPRLDEEGDNSIPWFCVIVMAVRTISSCAARFAGTDPETLANPKKQDTATYLPGVGGDLEYAAAAERDVGQVSGLQKSGHSTIANRLKCAARGDFFAVDLFELVIQTVRDRCTT